MTVSSTASQKEYAGNGTTTAFPTTFEFIANTDLVVVLRDSAGVETTQTLTTHYTVTGAGNDAGGTVTMVTPPATGEVLSIQRSTSLTQETDYVENDPFPAEAHEAALDKLTLIAQENANRINIRAIVAPVSDTAPLLELPIASERANEFLVFDANGDVAVSTGTGADAGLRADLADTTDIAKGDGLIWVKLAVTGAVARALHDWIEGAPLNVADLGAVSDGITDDSAAVQAAIDSFPDFVGGELYIPPNTAIASTITITSKKSLIITGRNGLGFPFSAVSNANHIPTLKWVGAAGGTMVQITDILLLTLRDMNISGEDLADYGLKFSGTTTGWGLGTYENLVIHSCEKNAVLKGATAGAGDFGRNHWTRCTFKISHAASGTAVDDAAYAYNEDSGVQDVFDHCEFHALSGGAVIAGSYGLWFEAGTPRVHLHDCYTKAENGVYTKASGATPKLLIADHYSEDTNFVSLANANTPQTLRNCVHPVSGGSSIIWGGPSGGGVPLIIDGGVYFGSVVTTNTAATVIINNSPNFQAAYPTFTEEQGKIIIGRANDAPAAETHAAINANCFVPHQRSQTSTTNITTSLLIGSIFPHLLTANAAVSAPINLDADGLDVGREVEYRITGDAGSVFTVTFNAIFLKAGGAYTHSGIGATDIIAFRWDGTNWWETRRSMDVQ